MSSGPLPRRAAAGAGADIDGIKTGTAPADSKVVATIQSPPLSDILTEMLVTSDNNTAEMLLKEIGHAAGGAGTRAAGLAAESATLAAWPLGTSAGGCVRTLWSHRR